MQIYGLFSNAGVARPAAPSTSTTGVPMESDNRSPASAALLLGADDEGTASRAAMAKKKIDEIKEQLRMLRFFASDSETLARLAKQLAQQLGTAAQQLAGAGDTGAVAGVASASGVAAAGTLAAAGSAQIEDAADDGQEVGASEPTTFAERAYREFSADDGEADLTAKVAAELKSVAEHLKQLLRKAEQDLRTRGSDRDADNARAAGHALSAAVGKLGGSDASAGNALTFPTSVSV